jgi:type IV fimbrial biogenesis protein FimT
LIVTVALLALLSSLAIPAFQDLQDRNRITGSVNLLLSHIQLARSRAVMDGRTVVICPTVDGASCEPDSDAWSRGWMVFQDADYRLPPQLDADDTLLLVYRHEAVWAALKTSPTHIRYSPTGFASNLTLTLCGREGSRHARAVIISITGRARVAQTAADGSSLDCNRART